MDTVFFNLVHEVNSLNMVNVVVEGEWFRMIDPSLDAMIDTNLSIQASSILKILLSSDTEGLNRVTIAVSIAGSLVYFDGSEWVASDGSISQSSGISQLTEDIWRLLPVNSVQSIDLRIWMRGNIATLVGTQFGLRNLDVTREVDEPTELAEVSRCILSGKVVDIKGHGVEGVKVVFTPDVKDNKTLLVFNGHVVVGNVEVQTTASGSFEAELIPSDSFKGITEVKYRVEFISEFGAVNKDVARQPLLVVIPNQLKEYFQNLV